VIDGDNNGRLVVVVVVVVVLVVVVIISITVTRPDVVSVMCMFRIMTLWL